MRITVKDIIEATAAEFDVTPADIRGPRRNKVFVVPRQIVYGLSRELTSRSYPEISHFIGHRDHTTVIQGERRYHEAHVDDRRTEITRIRKRLAALS